MNELEKECLVCGESGKARKTVSLFNEEIWLLNCTNCKAIISSMDGLHWNIHYQDNKWQQENVGKLEK